MKFLWRYVAVVAALMAGSLLLADCGGEEEEEAAAPTSATPAATEEVAPTKTPTDGEEEEEPFPPAPRPTPALGTPTGGADPEDFAKFAVDIARAVEEQDTAFFAARVKGRTYTCAESDFTEEGLGRTVAQGICEEVGQQVQVVGHSYWHSEGLSVRPEATVTAIEDYFTSALPGEEDDYGPGAVRLYAIGTTPSPDPARTYEAAILTAIIPLGEARDPARTVRGIHFEYADGRWVIRSMRFANVLAEELLSPDTAPYDGWERY